MGGSNTIDNILLLCKQCHKYWHDHPDDVSDLWMADQKKLLDSFRVGERVKRDYSCRLPLDIVTVRQIGVITQLFPTQRPLIHLRGFIYANKSLRRSGCAPPPHTTYNAHFYPSGTRWADAPESETVWEPDFGKAWREEAIPKALVHWLRTVKGIEVVTAETLVNLKDVRKIDKNI